jgi:hypothetical protein
LGLRSFSLVGAFQIGDVVAELTMETAVVIDGPIGQVIQIVLPGSFVSPPLPPDARIPAHGGDKLVKPADIRPVVRQNEGGGTLTEELRFAVIEQSLSELVHKCDPAVLVDPQDKAARGFHQFAVLLSFPESLKGHGIDDTGGELGRHPDEQIQSFAPGFLDLLLSTTRPRASA